MSKKQGHWFKDRVPTFKTELALKQNCIKQHRLGEKCYKRGKPEEVTNANLHKEKLHISLFVLK